jgi:hypothetical protein
LLSWSEKDDGSVVIIAPTGQKFTYSADEIMRKILEPTGLECGGTGAVIRTGDGLAEGEVPIAGDGMVTDAPEPGAGDVTKDEVPIAGDGLTQSVSLVTETPDPGAGVLTQSASQVTKAEEELVTDAAAAVAKDVAKAPAGKKSTRRRSTTSTRKKSEPDK